MVHTSAARLSLAIALLLAVVAGVFSPVLHNDFVNWDDQTEIYQNPDFNPVTIDGLAWNWRHTRMSLYMPLTYMTWGSLASISPRDVNGTLKPGVFHAFSILLHALCVTLVLLLLLQLGISLWPAWIGALVFAVHPIQAEAVAWASGMYTLLSTALSLGALILYMRFAQSDAKLSSRRIYYTLAILLFALALLTKAAAAATPLVAFAIDAVILKRKVKDSAIALVPWFILAIPVVIAAKSFQDLSTLPAAPFWIRPLVALDAIGFYVMKLIYPIGLVPDYGRHPTWLMRNLLPALPVMLIGAIVVVDACWLRIRRPQIAGGIAVFITGAAPYLGLTAFDFQYVSTTADRYVYFGMLGVATFVATLAVRIRIVPILILLTSVVWGSLTWQQLHRWQDTHRLFDYTLAENPNSLIAQFVLGSTARQEGRPAEAESRYKRALEIWPGDIAIRFNLGNLYYLNDRPADAVVQYQLAIAAQPNKAIYRNNLALAFIQLNRPGEAFDQLRTAIADDPDYADPHVNLGFLFLNAGQPQNAEAEFQAALRINPQLSSAKRGLERVHEARTNLN